MRVIPINVCHEVMNTSHIQKLDKTSFFFFVGGYPQVNQRCGKATKNYVQVVFPEPVFFCPRISRHWGESMQTRHQAGQPSRCEHGNSRFIHQLQWDVYLIYIYIIYEVYTHIYHIYIIYIYIECVYIIEYLYTHCTGKSTLVTSYIPI